MKQPQHKKNKGHGGGPAFSLKRGMVPSNNSAHNAYKKAKHTPKNEHTRPIERPKVTNDSKVSHRKPKVDARLDPTVEPEAFFDWMMAPISSKEFFSKYWEKAPLLISRTDRTYYDGWFTRKDLDRLLRTSVIKYGVNLDVVKCVDGKRETFTPTGRAYPASVWDFYENDGCSLRLLNPQTFCEPVWRMLSVLQEFFTSGMGANIYFTPANTQGFQVHYDDIEAFVLQLEGSKRWRVYRPRTEDETLPKHSSRNFDEAEVGTPVLDTVLHPGDMLYFPRGWIHQANATDEDSTHITVSTYQDWSWGTLLEKAVPRALQLAYAQNVEYRTGLPRGFLEYMGEANMDKGDPRRDTFEERFASLWEGLVQYLPLDAAVDQLGVRFIEDSYPPVLSKEELEATAAAGLAAASGEASTDASDGHSIGLDTRVRAVRRNVARIVLEDNLCVIYHSLENARVYHAEAPQKLEFPLECYDAIEYALNSWPKYVVVGDAPGIADDPELLDVIVALYDAGLLMRRRTL